MLIYAITVEVTEGLMMPPKKKHSATGNSVLPHQIYSPPPKNIDFKRAQAKTRLLVERMLGEYKRAHKLDEHWATKATMYYKSLIFGQRMPGNIKVDEQTRKLARGWVDKACETTGLVLPQQPPKKRKK